MLRIFNTLYLYFLLLFISSCYYHYTENIPRSSNYHLYNIDLGRLQLPVRIKLNITDIPESIETRMLGSDGKISQSLKVDPNFSNNQEKNYIKNYYSQEIISQFKMNTFFINNPNSNILIEILPIAKRIDILSHYQGFSFLTLYIIPSKINTFGEIQFKIYDSSKNELAKEYKYKLNHYSFNGFLNILLSPILPLFSDYTDHSTNEKTFSIMRRAFQAFHRDLRIDVHRDKDFRERFYLKNPPSYAVNLIQSDKESIYERALLSTLESTLISKGFLVFQPEKLSSANSKIDQIISLEEISLNRKKTRNTSILRINYKVKCLDAKKGNILWIQEVNHKSDESILNVQEIIHIAILKLFNQLSFDGII